MFYNCNIALQRLLEELKVNAAFPKNALRGAVQPTILPI